MAAWLAILALIVATIVLVASHDSGTIAGLTNDEFARVVALISIAILVGGSVASAYRGRVLQAIKHITAWVVALIVLIGIYTYRGELAVVADRMLGELSPAGSQVNVNTSPGLPIAVRIKRSWDGHFVATAMIEGNPVKMIVDTGASTVVLRIQDAKRLGINTTGLRYTVPVQTANGSSQAARVKLDGISIGNIRIGNVEALIAKPGTLHQSLLGMSFLSRLRSYEFAGDYLELRG